MNRKLTCYFKKRMKRYAINTQNMNCKFNKAFILQSFLQATKFIVQTSCFSVLAKDADLMARSRPFFWTDVMASSQRFFLNVSLCVLHQLFAFSFLSSPPLSTSSFVLPLTSVHHLSYFLELPSVSNGLSCTSVLFLW